MQNVREGVEFWVKVRIELLLVRPRNPDGDDTMRRRFKAGDSMLFLQ